MTVHELLEELKDIDGDTIVLLSIDSEGNNFHAVQDIGTEDVCEKYGYDYEIGPKEITEELKLKGYREDDALEDGKPCVVLWP